MTPVNLSTIIIVLSPGLVALATDLDAFSKAREKDPHAQFDLALCASRVCKGLIGGALTAMGVHAVNPGAGQ